MRRIASLAHCGGMSQLLQPFRPPLHVSGIRSTNRRSEIILFFAITIPHGFPHEPKLGLATSSLPSLWPEQQPLGVVSTADETPETEKAGDVSGHTVSSLKISLAQHVCASLPLRVSRTRDCN